MKETRKNEATFNQLNTHRKTRIVQTSTRLLFTKGSLDINGMEKKLTEYAYKPEAVASDTNSGDGETGRDSSPKPASNDSFFQMNNESQKTGPTTVTNQA